MVRTPLLLYNNGFCGLVESAPGWKSQANRVIELSIPRMKEWLNDNAQEVVG